jgi:hypothetical protein
VYRLNGSFGPPGTVATDSAGCRIKIVNAFTYCLGKSG